MNTAKPSVCVICGKEFISKTSLKDHMTTHIHVKINGCHVCTICNKESSQKCSLLKHLRTDSNVKRYTYFNATCGEGFTRRDTFQKQERTQTGEKPYLCGICGIGFTTNSNLRLWI